MFPGFSSVYLRHKTEQFMSNAQAISSSLKSGKLVFIHDTKGSYLAGSTRRTEAVKRLLELTEPEMQAEAFVAIAEASQLYDFVSPVPDLAWDIVEFAEKPLHIIYKGGKGVPEAVMPDDKIRVMLVLQKPLKDILIELRQGILCIPVDPKKVEAFRSDIAEAMALPPNSGGITADRIMELGPQGEIKFLKR
jgi:L-threonylcarbamoyladenylate synthase